MLEADEFKGLVDGGRLASHPNLNFIQHLTHCNRLCLWFIFHAAQKKVMKLLPLADKYGLEGCLKTCEEWLLQQKLDDNRYSWDKPTGVFYWLQHAGTYGLDDMLSKCIQLLDTSIGSDDRRKILEKLQSLMPTLSPPTLLKVAIMLSKHLQSAVEVQFDPACPWARAR
jgi:hypothetical protein